jgi:ADP-ribose pyrophosphatase YjhB (NUDIX family)
MLHLIPASIQRALMPLAYRIRHLWRKWRKAPVRGVSVVVTDLNGSVLLLRHSYGPPVWSLPGGGVGRSEDPEHAARRELKEELGISLKRLTALRTIEGVVSGAPHTSYLFSAICDEHPQPDLREVVEARFFPMHSLPEPLSGFSRARLNAWKERR